MPKIIEKLLEIIRRKKEEEEEPGITEEKDKDRISKWFKIPGIVNTLFEKIKGSETREQPEKKPARKFWSDREEKTFFKERSWKEWLRIIIFVIASTFMFYGLLWQLGILKY